MSYNAGYPLKRETGRGIVKRKSVRVTVLSPVPCMPTIFTRLVVVLRLPVRTSSVLLDLMLVMAIPRGIPCNDDDEHHAEDKAHATDPGECCTDSQLPCLPGDLSGILYDGNETPDAQQSEHEGDAAL
jgi:hypothetical protein